MSNPSAEKHDREEGTPRLPISGDEAVGFGNAGGALDRDLDSAFDSTFDVRYIPEGKKSDAFAGKDPLILSVADTEPEAMADTVLMETQKFLSLLNVIQNNGVVSYQELFYKFVSAADELRKIPNHKILMRDLLILPLQTCAINADTFDSLRAIFTLLDSRLLASGGEETQFLRTRPYNFLTKELSRIMDGIVKPKLEKFDRIRKDYYARSAVSSQKAESEKAKKRVPDDFKSVVDYLDNPFRLTHYFNYVPENLIGETAIALYENLIKADIQRVLWSAKGSNLEKAKDLIAKRLHASYAYEIFRRSEVRDYLQDMKNNFDALWKKEFFDFSVRKETSKAKYQSSPRFGLLYTDAAVKIPRLSERSYPIYILDEIRNPEELLRTYRMFYSWDFEALISIKDLEKRNEAIKTLKIRLGKTYAKASENSLPDIVLNFLKQRYENLQYSVMLFDFEKEQKKSEKKKRVFGDEPEIKAKEEPKKKFGRMRSLMNKIITAVAMGAALLSPSSTTQKEEKAEGVDAVSESVQKTREQAQKVSADIDEKAKIVVEDDKARLEFADLSEVSGGKEAAGLSKEKIASPRKIDAGKGVLHYVAELKEKSPDLAQANDFRLAYALSRFHIDASMVLGIEEPYDFSKNLLLREGEQILLPADGAEMILLDYLGTFADYRHAIKNYEKARKDMKAQRQEGGRTEDKKTSKKKPGLFKRAIDAISGFWRKIRG